MNIRMEKIKKAFGEKEVFNDFSVAFPEGQITGIMGASGCGKTTLLYMLAGLLSPDSGRIEGVPDKKAFVFQEDRLCPDFSVLRNLRLTGNRSSTEINCHLRELDMEESLLTKVSQLSGGMRRRIAIARAVLYRPELLLLDEPFKGLDDKRRHMAVDYIRAHTQGKTVIVVTHDQKEVELMGAQLMKLS